MDVQSLTAELERAQRDAEEAERAAHAATARARLAFERVHLLERLVENENALAGTVEAARDPNRESQPRAARGSDRAHLTVAGPETRESRPRRPRTAAVLNEAAKAALSAAHKPLHIAELRAAIERSGIPIPGRGEDANLIVHLRKSDDIVRVGRGFYALAEWQLPAAPAGREPRSRAH